MDIVEKVRQRILRFLHLEHLADNPNSERFTYVNNMSQIDRQKQDELWIWFKGDSDELLNYYTNQDMYGYSKDPIYNRNKRNYFWAISATESSIKRVHSGMPRAIVETLTNVIGVPSVKIGDEDASPLLDKINFTEKVNSEELPFTMVLGYGAFKIIINKQLSDMPILRFYNGKDVDFVCKEGIVLGIIYRDYYKYKDKDYLLLDTRRLDETKSSLVEYELFELKPNNSVTKVPLNTIPELSKLENVRIEGYPHILGVPCRFFKDPDRPDYGRSIYEGKIDLFDDLDQSLSQRSQTCRVSTPVEYYPSDLLKFDKNGNAQFPNVYNRQFVQKAGGTPNGDGISDGDIQTTQPQLNFEQYSNEQLAIVNQILIGLLSPASMGINIARDDNALAQREKEKVTIQMRDNIIATQEKITKELVQIILDVKEYMDTEAITLKDREISVKFPKFANPSFETQSQILTPMWVQGAISTKMYVDKLYGDSLSEEEKNAEITWLDENKKQEMQDALGGEFENDIVRDFGEEA